MSKDEIKSGKKGREVGRKQRFTENQGGKKKADLMLRGRSATTGESPELYQCTW